MSEYFEREESGLLFRFPIGAVWHVEKSQLYSSVQQNNKIADFVFRDESMKFWIIEAKTRAPKVENSQSFLSDLREKYINTGSLFAAVRLGFHPDFTGRQNAYMAGQLLGMSVEEITSLMPEIEAFAEIGDNRCFDDFARRFRHQTAHTGKLTNLRFRTTRS